MQNFQHNSHNFFLSIKHITQIMPSNSLYKLKYAFTFFINDYLYLQVTQHWNSFYVHGYLRKLEIFMYICFGRYIIKILCMTLLCMSTQYTVIWQYISPTYSNDQNDILYKKTVHHDRLYINFTDKTYHVFQYCTRYYYKHY